MNFVLIGSIVINQEITYSQVRANLAQILDSVSENREIVKITRRNGADAALIAAEQIGNEASPFNEIINRRVESLPASGVKVRREWHKTTADRLLVR
jgi:antitoxin (DNA-binding transcriptional repressor) of toxin-antitoxin stability system